MSGEALQPQSRRGSLHFILGRLGLDRQRLGPEPWLWEKQPQVASWRSV